MENPKINGVSFLSESVAKFKSAKALMESLPHIWKDLENREELFKKVFETVKPPKKESKMTNEEQIKHLKETAESFHGEARIRDDY